MRLKFEQRVFRHPLDSLRESAVRLRMMKKPAGVCLLFVQCGLFPWVPGADRVAAEPFLSFPQSAAMLPDRAFFDRLADAARAETLPRFRTGTGVVNKLDGGFDPVTEGDRAAETAIRALIEAHFPDHGILGEEHGNVGLDRDHVWVIDPIDGTRAFISGLPVWGTLIGLYHKGER